MNYRSTPINTALKHILVMGYMGFGMNKKAYTQRPKEAFKKIKDYGNDLAKNRISQGISTCEHDEIIKLKIARFKPSIWRTLLNLALFTGILALITCELYYLLSHLAIILVPFIF